MKPRVDTNICFSLLLYPAIEYMAACASAVLESKSPVLLNEIRSSESSLHFAMPCTCTHPSVTVGIGLHSAALRLLDSGDPISLSRTVQVGSWCESCDIN